MKNQYESHRGFLSFDNLFSILPIVLIVVYTIILHKSMIDRASSSFERQVLFDKLVSISDYIINKEAAKKEDGVIYPNWLSEKEFAALNRAKLAATMNLNSISVSFEQGKEKTCIYRLLVFGEKKEIKKLYICGE